MRRNAVSIGSILFLIAVLVAVLAGLFVFVSVAPTPRSTPSGQASHLLTATPVASATLTPTPTPSPTIEPTPNSSNSLSTLPTLPPVIAGTTGSSGSSGLIQMVLILLLALIGFGALWLLIRMRHRLRRSWHPTPQAQTVTLETQSETSAIASLLGRISAIRRRRPARQKAATPKSARMRLFRVVLPLALTVVLLVLITPMAFDVVNNSLTPLWNSMSPSDHNLIIIMLLGLTALLAALEAMAVQMRHRREEEAAQASERIEFKLGSSEAGEGEASELSELDQDLLRPKPFVPVSSLSTLGRSSLLDRILSRSQPSEPLQLTGQGLPRSTRGWRRLFQTRHKRPVVSVYEELATDATGLPGDFLIGLSRRERLRTRLATIRYSLAQTLRRRPVTSPRQTVGLLFGRLHAHSRASLLGAGAIALILISVVVLRFAPGLSLELAASGILFVALAVGAVGAVIVYSSRLREMLRRRREASVPVSPAEIPEPAVPSAPQILPLSQAPLVMEMKAPAPSVIPEAAPIIEVVPVPVAATSTPSLGLRQRLATFWGRFSRPRAPIHLPARPRLSLPRRSISVPSPASVYAHLLTTLRSSRSNRQIALIGGVLVLAILAAIGATRLTGGLPIEMAALVVMFAALAVVGVILASRALGLAQKTRRDRRGAGRPAGADIPDFVVLEVSPFAPVLDPFTDAAQLVEPEPVAEIEVPTEPIDVPAPLAEPVLRRRPPRWALASGAVAALLLVLAFGVIAVKLGSPTPSSTVTASSTNSSTLTPSPTASPTPVPTASPSPTASPTPVPTASPSPTVSPTPGPTASPTPSPTASPTPVPTVSLSPAPTQTTPVSASPSVVPTPSVTPSASASSSPSGIIGVGGAGGTNAGQWLLVFLLLFILMVLMLVGPLLAIRIHDGSVSAAIRRLRTSKRTASSVGPRAQTPRRAAHIKQTAARSVTWAKRSAALGVAWVGGFLVALGLAVRHGVSRAANAVGTSLAAMRHQISSISLRRTPSDLTPASPAPVSEKEPAAVVPEVSLTPTTIVETVPPSGPKTEIEPASRRPSRRQVIIVAAALCVVGVLAYFGARGLVSPQISASPTVTQTSTATTSSVPPTSSPSVKPSPTTSSSPSSTPSSSPSPVPTATPTPVPTATPSPTPVASPTSVYEARRAALPACSGVSACHVYTVVAGDSLSSIANYYGVSLAQLEQYNPQITTPNLIYADTAVRIPG